MRAGRLDGGEQTSDAEAHVLEQFVDCQLQRVLLAEGTGIEVEMVDRVAEAGEPHDRGRQLGLVGQVGRGPSGGETLGLQLLAELLYLLKRAGHEGRRVAGLAEPPGDRAPQTRACPEHDDQRIAHGPTLPTCQNRARSARGLRC